MPENGCWVLLLCCSSIKSSRRTEVSWSGAFALALFEPPPSHFRRVTHSPRDSLSFIFIALQ